MIQNIFKVLTSINRRKIMQQHIQEKEKAEQNAKHTQQTKDSFSRQSKNIYNNNNEGFQKIRNTRQDSKPKHPTWRRTPHAT